MASLSSLVQCLWLGPEPTWKEHLKDAPILGILLALLKNFRLGWKCQAETNNLAYYEDSQSMDIKSFITLAPGSNVIKLFMAVIYEFS